MAWSQVSNAKLAKMTSESERIMGNRAGKSFLKTFHDAELKSILGSVTEGPTFKPNTGLAPVAAVNSFISNPFIATELKD